MTPKSKLVATVNAIDRNQSVQLAFMQYNEDEVDRESVIAAVITAYQSTLQADLRKLKVRAVQLASGDYRACGVTAEEVGRDMLQKLKDMGV